MRGSARGPRSVTRGGWSWRARASSRASRRPRSPLPTAVDMPRPRSRSAMRNARNGSSSGPRSSDDHRAEPDPTIAHDFAEAVAGALVLVGVRRRESASVDDPDRIGEHEHGADEEHAAPADAGRGGDDQRRPDRGGRRRRRRSATGRPRRGRRRRRRRRARARSRRTSPSPRNRSTNDATTSSGNDGARPYSRERGREAEGATGGDDAPAAVVGEHGEHRARRSRRARRRRARRSPARR